MKRILASRPPLVSKDVVTGIKTVWLSPLLFAVPPGHE
jgi:hypothetical protein